MHCSVIKQVQSLHVCEDHPGIAWLGQACISHRLVVIGLLYVAYPDGSQHNITFLPRLRPYPVRGHHQKYTDPQSCDVQVERQLLLQLQQQQMTAKRKTGICPRAKEVFMPLALLVCHAAYGALFVLVLHCMQLRLSLNADLHRW